jgi:exonuclease VII small subunit
MSERTSTPDAAREQALRRLDTLEAELKAFGEGVQATAAGLLAELSQARAAVEQLHSAAQAADAGAGEVGEGARLVALDLVTRGVERPQAERELTAAFPDIDPGRALDDAAATLGL